jgi:hypothetical protein
MGRLIIDIVAASPPVFTRSCSGSSPSNKAAVSSRVRPRDDGSLLISIIQIEGMRTFGFHNENEDEDEFTRKQPTVDDVVPPAHSTYSDRVC